MAFKCKCCHTTSHHLSFDTDNIASRPLVGSTCPANSGDHREVVSHIFGRNKACPRELPNDLWIYWCRKHYQRLKYRAEDSEGWKWMDQAAFEMRCSQGITFLQVTHFRVEATWPAKNCETER